MNTAPTVHPNATENNNRDHFYNVIDTIISGFNFTGVHAYMTISDWKWRDGRVPTLDELRERATRLLWNCAAEYLSKGCAHTSSRTGGLVATLDQWNPNGSVCLNLDFSIATCGTSFRTDEKALA